MGHLLSMHAVWISALALSSSGGTREGDCHSTGERENSVALQALGVTRVTRLR